MIASCIDHAKTGVVLDEGKLFYDLPKIIKHLWKPQNHQDIPRFCREAFSRGYLFGHRSGQIAPL